MVGSLALGMAVTVATFAFLIALLLGPFPGVTAQHRLARLSASRNCGGPDCWRRLASPADLAAFREGLTGLAALTGYAAVDVAAMLPEAVSLRGIVASAGYFDVLGVRPAAGRLFDASDEDRHAAVAVLAHRLWVREFAADPTAIGRSIRVGAEFVQIIGVAPEFFVGVDLRPARGDRGPDIWLPLWLADRIPSIGQPGCRQPAAPAATGARTGGTARARRHARAGRQ